LEDASQAIGKPSDSFPIGQVGEISVYSFYENKQMTTDGEGGVIVTNNKKLAEICKSLRDQGRPTKRNWQDYVRLGYNYRMTESQAAIGRIQLKKLPNLLKKREVLARKYTEILKDIPEIIVPFESKKYKRSWFLYYLTFESLKLRKKVQKHLLSKGIESKTFFPQSPLIMNIKKDDIKRTILNIDINIIKRNGVLILDVNNRYNVLSYGIKQVIKNITIDLLSRSKYKYTEFINRLGRNL